MLTMYSQDRPTEWNPRYCEFSVPLPDRKNELTVQPTVLFDGLKEDSVSSSWGKDEWEKFLS